MPISRLPTLGRRAIRTAIAAPLLALAGCATTGATFRSGVGDAFLDRPPYLAGRSHAEIAADFARVGHLPVMYQRGAAQAPLFDPAASDTLQALLREMTAFVDSLGISARLAEGGKVGAVASKDTEMPPDVQFGCALSAGMSEDGCLASPNEARGRGRQQVRLAVGRPSATWTGWASSLMQSSDVDVLLVLTLEMGRYPIHQRGWKGDKEVDLGTNHTVRLPWLTSVEEPVWVVQLTGALVGRDGKAVRIGAEGLLARRTPLLASAVGAERLITDADVATLHTARRDDLPGAPLVWRQALRNLLGGLLSEERVAAAER